MIESSRLARKGAPEDTQSGQVTKKVYRSHIGAPKTPKIPPNETPTHTDGPVAENGRTGEKVGVARKQARILSIQNRTTRGKCPTAIADSNGGARRRDGEEKEAQEHVRVQFLKEARGMGMGNEGTRYDGLRTTLGENHDDSARDAFAETHRTLHKRCIIGGPEALTHCLEFLKKSTDRRILDALGRAKGLWTLATLEYIWQWCEGVIGIIIPP